jgi:lipopolysaccharide export system permease protein
MALKIYERHLAREIYATTGLVLLAFLMLFAFFDLIHQLESIGKGGYQDTACARLCELDDARQAV